MCGKIGCVCVDICLCSIYTHNITVTMAKMLINTIVYYKMYSSMRLFVTCVCIKGQVNNPGYLRWRKTFYYISLFTFKFYAIKPFKTNF